MTLQLKRAQRANVWLKIGIAAPSGGGKTFSALLLARGLVGSWEKVAVIDTENASASLYDHLGAYSTVDLHPPFEPEKYIDALNLCLRAGMKAVIVDSISHEWMGAGGALDIQTKLGGRFQDWAKVTPRHRAFLDAILQAQAHVICCSRTKTDWALSDGGNGKPKPEKVGTKLEQRDGLEYEYTIAWRLNEHHIALPEKDRTGLYLTPAGAREHVITQQTGERLAAWATRSAAQQAAPKTEPAPKGAPAAAASAPEPSTPAPPSEAPAPPQPTTAALNGKRQPAVYKREGDQEKRLQAILLKRDVPPEIWADIDRELFNKPFTALTQIVPAARERFEQHMEEQRRKAEALEAAPVEQAHAEGAL